MNHFDGMKCHSHNCETKCVNEMMLKVYETKCYHVVRVCPCCGCEYDFRMEACPQCGKKVDPPFFGRFGEFDEFEGFRGFGRFRRFGRREEFREREFGERERGFEERRRFGEFG